jgi:PAS domain S-box-containing protein
VRFSILLYQNREDLLTDSTKEKNKVHDERIIRKYLKISFAVFFIVICILGYYVYDRFRDEIVKKAEEELASVTNLKIQEIGHWRKERMRNFILLQNEAFGERIKSTFLNPDNKQVNDELLNHLVKFVEIYGYDRICLHDLDGKEFLKTSETEVDMPWPVSKYFDRIFGKKEIVFEDFYFDTKQNKIYLPMVSGQFDFKNNQTPLAVVIARIDPEEYLYPILSRWPIPRKTAQLHLVRKENDYAVFLNDVAGQEQVTHVNKFKISENKDLPSAKAVSGYTGIYRSKDIRGREVISYIKSVPDTPWFIIAKIEVDEINDSVKGIIYAVAGVIILLLVLFGIGTAYILKFQKFSYYREIAKSSKALEESEIKFRNMIEFAADGIILGSNEGFITEVNHTACELFGLTRNELIGKHFIEMPFTKESIDKCPPKFNSLNQGQIVISERIIQRTKDKTEITVEMKTKMMSDGTYQSIYRDITQRKKAEEEVNSLKSRFEYVLGATHTGFDMIDEDYNVIYVDPHWITALGNYQGKKCYEYFMGKPAPCESCAVPNAIETGTSTISEEFLEKENRFIEVHTIPLKEKHNGKRLVAEFNIDITEKKKIEKQLREFNFELETKVAERTAQLEETNRELESFSYSVSHDLRAPVRHIIGFTDIFAKEISVPVSEKGKDIFAKITTAGKKMERLIDDLLMLSRTSRQEMKKSSVEMNTIVSLVMADYNECKESRRIVTDISQLPVVKADRNLITIVWENLIDNACKYTKNEETAKIEIGFRTEGSEYIFHISDNGIGFDPEFTHKLFGVFQRLHLDKDFPGTGIGLANVRRIISRHGGRTWAESEGEGKGASFYFTLPIN